MENTIAIQLKVLSHFEEPLTALDKIYMIKVKEITMAISVERSIGLNVPSGVLNAITIHSENS